MTINSAIGHDDLFNIKSPVRIELTITPPNEGFAQAELVKWQYCVGEKQEKKDGEEVKRLDWRDFDISFEQGRIVLVKHNSDEIKQAKVTGINSRWIRCLVKGKLLKDDPLANLIISDIKIKSSPTGTAAASNMATNSEETSASTGPASAGGPGTQGLDPDAAFYNDLPLRLPASSENHLFPFGEKPRQGVVGTRPRPGDVFYLASEEAFSKKGARINILVDVPPRGITGISVERVHGIGKIFAERLREAGIRTTTDLLALTPQQVADIIRDRSRSSLARARNIQEAARKEYYDKVVTEGVVGKVDPNRSIPTLSWEYWNGDGWVALEDVMDLTYALTIPGIVWFTCPDTIASTMVIGQANYWIRARIAFGDYGQEVFTIIQDPEDRTKSRVEINTDAIRPPELSSLKISYDVTGQPPAFIVTFNNLQYTPQTQPLSQALAPFVALDDEDQSLYLGFDQAPLKGPISIFFSLQEQECTEENRPRVEWQYFRKRRGEEEGEWARLVITDGTRSLTESGTVEFIGPPDFMQARRFGQALYWIRAIDVENKFKPLRERAQEYLTEKIEAGSRTVAPGFEKVSVTSGRR